MEFVPDPSESTPVRRKPRTRVPKVTPPEETFVAGPIPKELQDFAQAGEIRDLPKKRIDSRNPGRLAQMDLVKPVLTMAFVLVLFSQILALRQTTSVMVWRVEDLDRQVVALNGVRNKASDVLKQSQGLFDETQRVSNNYNALLTELLKLAETDKDARSVVEKFNIKIAASAQAPVPPKK
jgi:hypothetical protein